MESRAWKTTVQRVAKSGTQLKRLSTHAQQSSHASLGATTLAALLPVALVSKEEVSGQSFMPVFVVVAASFSKPASQIEASSDFLPGFLFFLSTCKVCEEPGSGCKFPLCLQLPGVLYFHAATAAKSLQSCPTVRPHRRQPNRLPCPWDSPGKNTGVGCHFLLQCMKVKSENEVAQSCPTLSEPMVCSLPGSSVHGILGKSTGVGCHCLLKPLSIC